MPSTMSASSAHKPWCTPSASRMPMGLGHAEPTDRVALEVEFDEHHRLFPYDPPIVPRLDRHDLWSLVLHDTPVRVADVNFPLREESDVRVHTHVGPHDWLHVDGPPEAGGVHHALDAGPAGTFHLEPDAADL